MIIKNYKELATTPLRKDALEIIDAGLRSINTSETISANVRLTEDALKIDGKEFRLEGIKRIFVVGIGKCAFEAGETLERILGDRLTGGIVLDVHKGKLHKIKSFAGTHPFMSEINIDITKEIITLLNGLTEKDLVIFVVSGGGSALLCQPNNFTCQDESLIVGCLMKSGVPINELNTVRKHLSLARGGYLAQYAYPAKVVSLIFSDIPGDDLEFVASGPTMKDTTSIEDAERILKKYGVLKTCAKSITLIETPKDSKYFEKVSNILLISNRTALEAMKNKADELGYEAKIMTTQFSGEARELGPKILGELSKEKSGAVLLYGGESTVTIKKPGKGGRNLEMALAALLEIKTGQLLATVATDGMDNTEYAGALCDERSAADSRKKNLDPKEFIEENRSFEFWEKTGDYLLTGITGSNVSDIIIAICE